MGPWCGHRVDLPGRRLSTSLKSRLVSNRLFGAARVACWQTYTIILVHEHLSLRGHAVSVQGSPHNKEMMRRATAISFLIILKSKEHLASVCPQAKSLLIAELPLCTRATKLEVFIESQGGRLDSPSWMCEAVMSLIAEVEQVIGKQFQKSVFRHCAVGGPLDPDDEFAEGEFDLD